MKHYLEDEDLQRALMCNSNIIDKMESVSQELRTVQKPNKSYLLEKLESIAWDVNVLIRMCKGENEDEKSDEQRGIEET